jgi:hypothetical protein
LEANKIGWGKLLDRLAHLSGGSHCCIGRLHRSCLPMLAQLANLDAGLAVQSGLAEEHRAVRGAIPLFEN